MQMDNDSKFQIDRLLLLQLLEKFELIPRSTEVGQQKESNREHPERFHHHFIVANRLFWLCEIFVNFRIVSEFPIFALRSPEQLQFFSDFAIFARRAPKRKAWLMGCLGGNLEDFDFFDLKIV